MTAPLSQALRARACPRASSVCRAKRAPLGSEKRFFDDVDPEVMLNRPVKRGGEDDTKRSKDRYQSAYVWNTNWQERWDQRKRDEAHAKAVAERKARADPSDGAVGPGYLSPSRKLDLNDMSIDLSAQLAAPPKPLLPPQPPGVVMMPAKRTGKKYSDPPTKGEQRRFDRGRGFAVRGPAAASVATRDPDAEVAEERARELARYEQARREYSMWTTGTTAVLFAMCYALYTKDVAASYLVGAFGGIVYLRLLNRSVDAVGADGLGAAAGGVASQPRLLIPVVLVLVFNRYNELYASNLNLTLQLLPMLAGFFTYKAGVLGRSSVALYRELSGKGEDSAPRAVQEDVAGGEGEQLAGGAQDTVVRAGVVVDQTMKQA